MTSALLDPMLLANPSEESVRHAAAFAPRAFVLASVDMEVALAWQERLFQEVQLTQTPTLVIAEHPLHVSIGRQGFPTWTLHNWSWAERQGVRVSRVARAGGCWLHAPGMIAVYPIFPLGEMGMSPAEFAAQLAKLVHDWLGRWEIATQLDRNGSDLLVQGQVIGSLGVAIRGGISRFGLNISFRTDLDLARTFRVSDQRHGLTSIEREARRAIRPSHVRDSLLQAFACQFGFGEWNIHTDHPWLQQKARAHAYASVG